MIDLIERYYPVLDHGFVALVDKMGTDASIVQAARVSYGAGTKKAQEDRDLIRYLLCNEHTTPFEMCELKFHVKLPIFVARQLVRHRTASLNEYSLRYSLAPLMFYMPPYESVRNQSATNRQGRGEQADREVYDRIRMKWEALRESASEVYQDALVEDIARELARIDLPLSLYTEWYWKIDLNNFFRFLKLRADSHAQEEIQAYARVKGAIVQQLFPHAFEAFVDYSFESIRLSRMERALLGKVIDAAGAEGYLLEHEIKERSQALGMTKREADEFLSKLDNLMSPSTPWELPAVSHDAQHFYDEAQTFVPDLEAWKARRAT